MKLTLKIKLRTTPDEDKALLDTMQAANAACNEISRVSFARNIFGQFKIHHETYHSLKEQSGLTAQMVVRCISKVTDAYKIDRKVQREFRPKGAISYDSRILSYKTDSSTVSIWTVAGRLKIPFACHNTQYVPYIKGEADLVCKKGKFYLYQTVDVPEEAISSVEEFIGVDFGQTDIAVLSDGTSYNSEQLKAARKKKAKVRASLQSKGTKGAKRLLRRLSGKERGFVSNINHTISKKVVAKAKEEGKGIAIEDLSHIRKNAKPKSKAQKTELNRWGFNQLRQYFTYKATRSGVPLVVVPPAYTSQTCAYCKHMGDRNGKRFTCDNCGNKTDADYNAALNIAAWGCVINHPEKSDMLSCTLSLHH